MELVAETNHDIVDRHKMNQDIVVEVEELGDGIWTEFPPQGLLALFIEFWCLEFIKFWWRSLTVVLANMVVDAVVSELFTLAIPLLAVICIGTWAELWSLFEFWGIVCCYCCCCCPSGCGAWLWNPDEELVLRGNLAKLSETK